jgi:hypothetical protein
MSKRSMLLDQVRVASPCPASWETMDGDDRVRFCSLCEKNVYNLSALNAAAAQALVEEHADDLCVRFYRRRDGTMLTADCPVGLRRARRRLATWAGILVTACLAATFFGLASAKGFRGKDAFLARLREVKPLRPLIEWLDPSPPVVGWLCRPAPAAEQALTGLNHSPIVPPHHEYQD